MPSVPESARAIAEALAPEQASKAARWRWGTVVSVQDDGTITATVGGTAVEGIRASQHAMGAEAGDRVRICYIGTEAFADSLRASSKLIKLPSIEADSLTLGSPLAVANGGTGADNAADARANILAVGYQSGMNAAIANFTGANQLWGLRAKVINTNSSLNGDSVYILLRSDGISCYDTTASSYPWQLTLPSGTTDLTVNVGTPTLNSNATATTFETRRQGKAVNLQVYQLKVASALADGSSISLGTGIIGSNARPSTNVYMPLMANVSGKGSGCFLYVTPAGNVTLYNRSGSSLGTGTNLAGNTTWVV